MWITFQNCKSTTQQSFKINCLSLSPSLLLSLWSDPTRRYVHRHYSTPLIPKTPGLETFPMEIMHSHDYRHPEHFRGKTVLCLGAAASGMDISIDISAYANQVGCEVSADLLIRTREGARVSGINLVDMRASLSGHSKLLITRWWTCDAGFVFEFPKSWVVTLFAQREDALGSHFY